MSPPKMNLNAVRGREDWWLGVAHGDDDHLTVEAHRHSDYATIEITLTPRPLSFAEVHAEAVRRIEEWEAAGELPRG